MNPREFLKLASELVADATPVKIRTGINRAYYAAHSVGVEVLTGMGCTIDKGPGGHGDVRMRLNNSGDMEVTKAASWLGDLQTKRNKADYRLDNKDVENQKTAQALVEQARWIIVTLDGCHGGSRGAQIKKQVQEWERKTRKT